MAIIINSTIRPVPDNSLSSYFIPGGKVCEKNRLVHLIPCPLHIHIFLFLGAATDAAAGIPPDNRPAGGPECGHKHGLRHTGFPMSASVPENPLNAAGPRSMSLGGLTT